METTAETVRVAQFGTRAVCMASDRELSSLFSLFELNPLGIEPCIVVVASSAGDPSVCGVFPLRVEFVRPEHWEQEDAIQMPIV